MGAGAAERCSGARRSHRGHRLCSIVTALALGALGLGVAPAALATGASPASHAPTQIAANHLSPDQRFIDHAYTTLLSRSADTGGTNSWTAALTRGTPRLTVASGLTQSAENRTILVQAAYQQYFSRPADPAGLTNWLPMIGGRLTIPLLDEAFVTSAEYLNHWGSSPAAWVASLYSTVLHRTGSDGEVAAWTASMIRGASRDSVAEGFLMSSEHLNAVVDGWYHQLLGRGADPSGLTS